MDGMVIAAIVGVSGVNLTALLGAAFGYGRLTQRVTEVEKKMDRILDKVGG